MGFEVIGLAAFIAFGASLLGSLVKSLIRRSEHHVVELKLKTGEKRVFRDLTPIELDKALHTALDQSVSITMEKVPAAGSSPVRNDYDKNSLN